MPLQPGDRPQRQGSPSITRPPLHFADCPLLTRGGRVSQVHPTSRPTPCLLHDAGVRVSTRGRRQLQPYLAVKLRSRTPGACSNGRPRGPEAVPRRAVEIKLASNPLSDCRAGGYYVYPWLVTRPAGRTHGQAWRCPVQGSGERCGSTCHPIAANRSRIGVCHRVAIQCHGTALVPMPPSATPMTPSGQNLKTVGYNTAMFGKCE